VRVGGGVDPQPSPDGTRLLVRDDLSYLSESILQPGGGKPMEIGTAFAPRWSPDGTRIAFVRNNLWVIGADGNGEQQLSLDVNQAVWSPDGKTIAFVSGGRTDGLYILNPDGARISITRPGDPAPDSPDWSPDGRQIAYVATSPDGHNEIYLAPADGSQSTQLAAGASDAADPAWSPDGTEIAFIRSGRIWTTKTDGTALTAVTATARQIASPAWSPDGRSIAFELRGAKHAQINVVDVASGAERRLTPQPEAAHRPRWSTRGEIFYSSGARIRSIASDGSRRRSVTTGTMPAPSRDGSQLTFRRDGDIWVASADGTKPKRVLPSGSAADPTWSPTGSIAYLSKRPTGIATVSADGGAPTTVTTGSASGLAWSPDGQRLSFIAVGEANARRLIVHDIASGNERTLASAVDGAAATWSADGSHLAFLRMKSLYVVASGGPDEHQLATAPVTRFVWAPAGNLIAYDGGAPSSVYVVDPDSSATTKVSSSVAGESSFAPSWSPDGRTVAFLHARVTTGIGEGDYYNADVEVAAADGGSHHALTSPFPDGGANDAPVWARVPATAPPPETLQIKDAPTSQAVGVPPVSALSANGDEALLAIPLPPNRTALMTWQPNEPATRLVARACASVTHAALVADTLAFTTGLELIEPTEDATLGALARPVGIYETLFLVRRHAPGAERPLCRHGRHVPPLVEASVPVHIQAAGDRLLYDTRPDGGEHVLWTITHHHRRQITSFKDGSRPLDVGGPTQAPDGRIVVPETGGVLIFDPASKRARHLHTGRPVLGAGMSGTRLAVLDNAELTVLDSNTGRRLLGVRLSVAGTAGPAFAGVGGRLAAYVAGTAVHLVDVTNGRDFTLRFPDVTDGIRATLNSRGLFVTYVRAYTPRSARLAFLSTSSLQRLLR
jgi:Tol biopolymer transport system component